MITDTQTFGITLPIQHGPRGYFNQSRNVSEQVKSNLTLLLKSKKGERRMNPEFGSGLWSVLFENITDDLKPIIESTIRKDISNWLNYITVQSVDVQYNTDNNYNRVSVSVKYVAASAGIYDQQVLNVQMITNNI